MAEKLQIKPYARLLTMLGDQLIADEKIALVELIKNSYDADASKVEVRFENFGENYKTTDDSRIIITDDGCGMNEEVIREHWLNPGTPEKSRRKEKQTPKGRILQGEKGIGRFAMLKLGKCVDLYTKTDNGPEHHVKLDLSGYEDDFVDQKSSEHLFLENIEVSFDSSSQATSGSSDLMASHGTSLEISDLRGKYLGKKVQKIFNDLLKLQPSLFFGDAEGLEQNFSVSFYKNGVKINSNVTDVEEMKVLRQEKAVLRIRSGRFDPSTMSFEFCLNGTQSSLELDSEQIRGQKLFRERFGDIGSDLKNRLGDCGAFEFEFDVFDLQLKKDQRYGLDREQKEIIKKHRIYLYRDGIRVYPYGETEDDWLQIDMLRGVEKAGHYLSNDQVVGVVKISREGNQHLRDKTNREGLIDDGEVLGDFICLLQIFLSHLRTMLYRQYLEKQERRKTQNAINEKRVESDFDSLIDRVKDNKQASGLAKSIKKEYTRAREYLTRRAEITEELAGVGLSVEAASHDLMLAMTRICDIVEGLLRGLHSGEEISRDKLIHDLQAVMGGLALVKSQMRNIQTLFGSSRTPKRKIRIEEVVEKVKSFYARALEKHSIDVEIDRGFGRPLVVETGDAVLFQLFINLFDNAVHWLETSSSEERNILVKLDGDAGSAVFADDGPGIREDDKGYIFEPFYSGKGIGGRGLGLYIARQLLEKSGFSITLAESKSDKILSGANFRISFIEEKS